MRLVLSLWMLCGFGTLAVGCDEDSKGPGDAQGQEPSDGDAGDDSDPGPDETQVVSAITFSHERSFTIAQDQGHLAFPDLARLKDGRLLLVYRQGGSHVDASGKIMKQFAAAGGTGWTDPAVLLDVPNMDDRDPSVSVLEDGTVLLSYFQYRTKRVGGSTLILHQVFTSTSSDDGTTFSAPTQVTPGDMDVEGASLDAEGRWVDSAAEPIMVTACSSPARIVDDTVVIPAYGGATLNLGDLANSPRSRISLLWSRGSPHQFRSEIVAPNAWPTVWLQEPALLPLQSGKLLMQVRTATSASPSSQGKTAQSISLDDGASWSEWRNLDFVGHAPYLVQLENGVVLSAFRELNDAFTHEWVSFVSSVDEGDTFSPAIRVADCGAAECGYPSVVELEGDRILVVYYSAGGGTIEGSIYGFDVEYL